MLRGTRGLGNRGAPVTAGFPQLSPNAQATDKSSVDRHFGGGENLLPLWIAEPYLPLAPEVVSALTSRAADGWFGYETRPASLTDAFWSWMKKRHQWEQQGLHTLVSPSVGTSVGVLIEQMTNPGDGVILQPPVFTDFKPLVTSNGRKVVRNSLALTSDGYSFDLDDLEDKAADPTTTALILCNPHNPVGRVWTADELSQIANICSRNGLFVIADEIHADIVHRPHAFTPFASMTANTGVQWAALHGPIKTFGLAGVCDTFVITGAKETADRFETVSSQFHLTRNNVFAIAASHAAYTHGAAWLDDMLKVTARNAELLRASLPEPIKLVEAEGTYLAWLDFRDLGMEVPELANWLAQEARLALSPGHWFGRDGAGFARMTIAAPTHQVEQAISRLADAIGRVRPTG